MLSRCKRNLAIVGVICVVAASIVLFAWNASLSFGDDPSSATISMSLAESKARAIWAVSLLAVPAELTVPGQTVHIDSAWVEASSHRTERPWGFSERPLNGYNLCFTVAEPVIDRAYFFVPDDRGAGVATCSRSRNLSVYTTDLKDPSDVTTLRLSLISSWQAPRPKNIRFVAQR